MASRTIGGLILAVSLLCIEALATPPKPWGAPKDWWKTQVKQHTNKDGSPLATECLDALTGEEPQELQPPAFPATEISSSGRDGHEFQRNVEASNHVDKAADLLGIARPPKRVEFVSSHDLAQLATLGRPAVGHWHDGSMIATQAFRVMGVLEFVTPGCPTCRSFFSDGVTPEHQIEIFKHVLGHDSFSYASMYCQIRQPCDPITAAEEMFEFFEDTYRRYDADEVMQWYQYLLTLGPAQDFARGTFLPPEAFKKDPVMGIVRQHPAAPTASELQFTVSNLPDSLPAWKRKMAEIFERMERMKGYVIQTKVINEGWAFFMQDFLTPYLPYLDDHHVIESALLKTGVGPARLDNVYWLGREGWRNLQRKFESRIDIRDLSKFERDKKFIEYSESIRHQYNDYQFLRLSLDEEWIRKYNLFLFRKAEWHEWDQALPRPSEPNKEQKVVVSTNPRDVTSALATKYGDRSRVFPEILLEDESATSRNVFSLRHENVGNIPLKLESAVQAMYVRSQIWSRAVSLKTIDTVIAEKLEWDPMVGWKHEQSVSTTPIRIEVSPDGKVELFQIQDGKEVSLDEVKQQRLQEALDAYRDDQGAMVHSELEREQNERFSNFISIVADNVTRPSVNQLSRAPNSATALLRYYQMLQRRMYNAIMRAVNGKAKVKKVRKGMRVKVLPDIPTFAYDLKIARALEKLNPLPSQSLEVTPSLARSLFDLVRQASSEPEFEFTPNLRIGGESTDTMIDIGGGGPRTPRKGDRIWGDPEPKGGNGDGEEDGDGDPQPGGKKPGDGGGEPPDETEIDIPLEVWAEFLKEEIELPRLRPKGGPSELVEFMREDSRLHTQGEIQWNRMMGTILTRGKQALKKSGKDLSRMNPRDVIKAGLRLVQPSDWRVPDSTPVPIPDINAVVIIWMDMTGSMMGKPIELAKDLMFNLKTLLASKYKNVKFRYIGFTTISKEYPDEETFFKSFLNGGTDYNEGIKKTSEIIDEYNPSQWDVYTVGIGDAEDQNGAVSAVSLGQMVKKTSYSAFVRTDVGHNWPDPTFMAAVMELASQDEYFGQAVLTLMQNSGVDVLKELFGKNKVKK